MRQSCDVATSITLVAVYGYIEFSLGITMMCSTIYGRAFMCDYFFTLGP